MSETKKKLLVMRMSKAISLRYINPRMWTSEAFTHASAKRATSGD